MDRTVAEARQAAAPAAAPAAPGRSPAPTPAPGRSPADLFMKRLLRVPLDRPTASAEEARSAFSKSIAVSTVRCLLTYVLLPLLAPIVDLTGNVGPILALVLATVSTVAIIISMRRFWAADHRMRWGYTIIGGAIIAFMVVGGAFDIFTLLT